MFVVANKRMENFLKNYLRNKRPTKSFKNIPGNLKSHAHTGLRTTPRKI